MTFEKVILTQKDCSENHFLSNLRSTTKNPLFAALPMSMASLFEGALPM